MNKNNIKSGVNLRVISFCLLLVIVFSLSGCATNGILGIRDPLATSSYVDSKITESDRRIVELEEEIQQLLDEISLMKSDIELVSNIKADLDEMPMEMLRQLVLALQSYLEMLENEG